MTTADKHPKDESDELTSAVQRMDHSLQRLVELGESVVDVLERSCKTQNAAEGNTPPQAPACRSDPRSIHSKEVTALGVFDLTREDLITFAEASGLIPTHPSTSTISRWCTIGCRGIKLESIFIGGRRRVSRESVERFLIRCRERGWAGIDGNTAWALEQALAEKGWLVKPPQHDDPAQPGPKLPSRTRSKTAKSRHQKSGRGDTSTRTNTAAGQPNERHPGA
jgi:hypothetical protein